MLFKSIFFNFSDNCAGESGSNLFGGLLDRCQIHDESSLDSNRNSSLGLVSFHRSSNIIETDLNTTSSYPVLLSFCRDNIPDCNYQPETVHIDKRNPFFIELIAYDQSLNVVNGSIYTSCNSSAGGLNEGQQIQNVNEACTKLTFTLFSPHNVQELTLSVEGPCNVSGTSKRHVLVKSICTCRIGFQVSNNDQDSCDCVCNSVLQAFQKTECDAKLQSFIKNTTFG